MNNPILVIMAKKPQVGRTKTRMRPTLTSTEAAQLYEALLKDSIVLISGLEEIELAIAVTPPESILYFRHISPSGTLLIPIECVDIGDCLTQVFECLLEMGYPKVLAFNADGPSVPPQYIHTAVQRLDQEDIVLGPSEDGGYYLVGMKQLFPQIFSGIAWSTPQVLAQTSDKIEALGLRAGLLPPWYDVDTATDLERLQAELTSLPNNRLTYTRQFLEQLPSS
jgi:rSAM/selenodomain-associated transferase 1